MIAATHAAFATGLYLGGSALFEYPAGPVGWGLAVFFSIVPDIDLPTSRIGRPLFWLSVRLERQHGHRTVTHSLVALLLVAGVASPLFAVDRGDWYWAILGGYWSHLWLDMLNVRGIDLFWPSPIRVVMPGRTAYRLEVGSKAEMVLLSGLVVLAVAMVPVSRMGVRGGLHQLLRNFDMAFDEYRVGAGTHWYRLDLAAIDNLTLEHVRWEKRSQTPFPLLVSFQPRSLDVWALADIGGLVEETRSVRDGLRALAVLNLADPGETSTDNADAAAAVADFPEFEYLPTPIRRRKAFANAAGSGMSVLEQRPADKKAVDELRALLNVLF